MTNRQAIELLIPLTNKQGANWTLQSILDVTSVELMMSFDNELSFGDEIKVIDVKRRLEENEPLQYILGTWQFIDINVKTDKRALIPRPETEYLALNALDAIRKFDTPKVLDIGCGTGCIGLYLKTKMASIDLELIDISADALALAKENAILLNVCCEFTHADMRKLNAIPCDVIVSNPPYIKSSDVLELESSVKDYEPHLALDGGEDGLDYYRALLQFANNSLSEKGVILMEIGINQAHDVAVIFTDYFKNIHIIKDFNGIERIVIARRD